MKKLLKQYNFTSDMQYFEYIVDSLINGQQKQAIILFLSMPKGDRVQFIASALTVWQSGLTNEQISLFVRFIYFSKPQ